MIFPPKVEKDARPFTSSDEDVAAARRSFEVVTRRHKYIYRYPEASAALLSRRLPFQDNPVSGSDGANLEVLHELLRILLRCIGLEMNAVIHLARICGVYHNIAEIGGKAQSLSRMSCDGTRQLRRHAPTRII